MYIINRELKASIIYIKHRADFYDWFYLIRKIKYNEADTKIDDKNRFIDIVYC